MSVVCCFIFSSAYLRSSVAILQAPTLVLSARNSVLISRLKSTLAFRIFDKSCLAIL